MYYLSISIMAALNTPESAALRRRVFVDQTIQLWTGRVKEAEQALVEYTENTPNPVASRVQVLRRAIERARNSLDTFVVEREQLREGRVPIGLRQRVVNRSLSRSPSPRRSRRRSRSRRGRSSSSNSSRSRSRNRGLSRGFVYPPPNRTRRRSRCPQGSNCSIS